MGTCGSSGEEQEPEQDRADDERRGSTAPSAGEFVHVDFTPAVDRRAWSWPGALAPHPAVGRGCWITSWVLDGRPELPFRRRSPYRTRARSSLQGKRKLARARGRVRTIVRPGQGTGPRGVTTTFVSQPGPGGGRGAHGPVSRPSDRGRERGAGVDGRRSGPGAPDVPDPDDPLGGRDRRDRRGPPAAVPLGHGPAEGRHLLRDPEPPGRGQGRRAPRGRRARDRLEELLELQPAGGGLPGARDARLPRRRRDGGGSGVAPRRGRD